VGKKREQACSSSTSREQIYECFCRAQPKELCVLILEKEEKQRFHKVLQEAFEKMEQSFALYRRRAMPQRRSKEILRKPQKNFQTCAFSSVHAGTEPVGTVLETCKKSPVEQTAKDDACCEISSEENV
jgi:hypothetical protein